MEELNERYYMELLDFNKEKRKKWMKERKPYSVLFEITPRCNMNCKMCYLKQNHMEQQLSYEEIIEIIDILYDKGILFLVLTGGEILTRKDFCDIYLYAKKKGFLVELFSNGYLFTDEIIDMLKEYPPLFVDISLYGVSNKTYKEVTGVNGAFDKVIENCRKLKDAGIRVSMKSPIINETAIELDKMKQLATEMGIQFVNTFEIIPTINGDISNKSLALPLETVLKNEFENYYEQIEEGRRKLGEVDFKKIEELSYNDNVFNCNVALNSFVIDYNGNICPCMKLRHCGEKLTRENFDIVWKQFESFSSMKASKNYKCKMCSARYYCDVCPGESDLLFGNMEYRTEEMCIPAKARKLFYENKISVAEVLRRVRYNLI